MKKPKWWIFWLVVFTFAIFVWPTPYKTVIMSGNTLRINRINYCADVYTPTGWKHIPNFDKRCISESKNKPPESNSNTSISRNEQSSPLKQEDNYEFAKQQIEIQSIKKIDQSTVELTLKNKSNCLVVITNATYSIPSLNIENLNLFGLVGQFNPQETLVLVSPLLWEVEGELPQDFSVDLGSPMAIEVPNGEPCHAPQI